VNGQPIPVLTGPDVEQWHLREQNQHTTDNIQPTFYSGKSTESMFYR